MPIKIKLIDPHGPPPEKEGVWARCANGHVFGDGKNVDFTKPCDCGADVIGFNERRIMPLEDFKGIYSSKASD